MNTEYLFVYGTLRKDYGLKLLQEVADKITLVGQGTVNATLYDLGSYPAAIDGLKQNEVRGDVYRVLEKDRVFALLDEYEGGEYTRKSTAVRMETGKVLEAWIYWYTGTTDGLLLIEENDYLNYLKNKKDRFL